MKPIPYKPDSDQFDALVRGTVMANRVNDILARKTTDRYKNYRDLVRAQWEGESDVDPADEYRQRAKTLVPRAMDAYEIRNGVSVKRNLFFRHPDPDLCIGAAPDGVDGNLIGITVHVRQTLDTYKKARERGLDTTMIREAQAMMTVTGLEYWLHINYYEDARTRTRKIQELDIVLDELRAKEIEDEMIEFLAETRGVKSET